MKKIVGILAAAALATSVFAVDFSGGVRLEGDLFNYNGEKETAQALMLKNCNQFWQAPLALSVTSDRAGATIKFTDKDSNAFETGKWAIWFKPMDMLQVNLGTISKFLHRETIDYTHSIFQDAVDGSIDDAFGASLDVNIDAFTMTVSVVPGNGDYWFKDGKSQQNAKIKEAYDKYLANPANYDAKEAYDALDDDAAKEAAMNAWYAATVLADPTKEIAEPDAALAQLNLYAGYTADFGEIIAMFNFADTFKDITMGAGYKNTFGDLTIWGDAGINMKKATKDDDFVNQAAVAADVTYAKDALNAQACVKWLSGNLKDISSDTMKIYSVAKVAYTLDMGTVYLYFKDENLLAKDFAATIKPGFESDVGIMHYELAVQFDVAKKVTISVPVNFKVAF
jgi:hypothetical protein